MDQSKCIKTVFWNLGNLFDTKGNEIATDFEFISDRGYDDTAKKSKIEYLAKGLKSLDFELNNNDNFPDLIGLCAVENRDVLQELITSIHPTKYEIAGYKGSPDLRGIDACLVYSRDF